MFQMLIRRGILSSEFVYPGVVFMRRLINRLNDYAFKRIFGVEENKDILLDFLNAVILTDVSGPLTEITLCDRELDPEFIGDKTSRLDILAKSADGMHINIEVQIVNLGNPRKRSLYYWSRLYGGQLTAGLQYEKLSSVIAINVVNFACLPDPERFHHTYQVLEIESREPLTRDCEIHFLELPKFTRLRRPVQTRLDKWLTYLSNAEGSEMEAIAMSEPMIKKAITIEEIFAKNDHERRLYELREKGLRDIESIRLEGRTEERLAIAQAMLSKGATPAFVAETTGLSIDEVKRLTDH